MFCICLLQNQSSVLSVLFDTHVTISAHWVNVKIGVGNLTLRSSGITPSHLWGIFDDSEGTSQVLVCCGALPLAV